MLQARNNESRDAVLPLHSPEDWVQYVPTLFSSPVEALIVKREGAAHAA
jgi:hypothetical protein